MMTLSTIFFCIFVLSVILFTTSEQQSLNGGSFFALAGQDSVLIATDSRFTTMSGGSFLLKEEAREIIQIGSKTLVGCFGLQTDIKYFFKILKLKLKSFRDEEIAANSIARLISQILHRESLLVAPVVAGFDDEKAVYLAMMDSAGALTETRSYALTGDASSGLLAACEAEYIPNLLPEELVEKAERCIHRVWKREVAVNSGDVKIVSLVRSRLPTTHMRTSKDITNSPQNSVNDRDHGQETSFTLSTNSTQSTVHSTVTTHREETETTIETMTVYVKNLS
jgi:20S proteasome alpha/beta subunit